MGIRYAGTLRQRRCIFRECCSGAQQHQQSAVLGTLSAESGTDQSNPESVAKIFKNRSLVGRSPCHLPLHACILLCS